MNDLEMYREQLALCDDKIIDALVERSSIIEKIMAYKEEYGMPILQPHQEEKQKRRLEEKLKENKYKEEIFDVFGCILRNSKRIQARKLFGLRSANFTMSFGEDGMAFETVGYGHGVGMSQSGANAMGKNQSSYQQILQHYYTGVSFGNVKDFL